MPSGLRALLLGRDAGRTTAIEKTRVLGLNDAHQKIAGACRVYQIRLSGANVLPKVRSLLQSTAKMPAQMSFASPLRFPTETFERSRVRLETMLTDTAHYGKSLQFPVRFQMHRMACNGYLSPLKVISLLPAVQAMVLEKGSDVVAHALRNLARSLPLPGPDTCQVYKSSSLESELLRFADEYDSGVSDNPYELVKRHSHVMLVHRALITPTGLYLEGPEPEPANRVLRRFQGYTDHFIRVVLCDEDGGPVRYDPRASQRVVYDDRFRDLLKLPLFIAGKAYDFFGFSNSALRSHSCWFMAPIPTKSGPFYAALVLKALGNFEMIRTPAKCAARVGQNFTDTNDTIELSSASVGELPVVIRNGYDFSDGVGTISSDLLRKVWQVYGTKRLLKPTALQIRFQGAKGMVSLDTRLKGERMLLRFMEARNLWSRLQAIAHVPQSPAHQDSRRPGCTIAGSSGFTGDCNKQSSLHVRLSSHQCCFVSKTLDLPGKPDLFAHLSSRRSRIRLS